ncbi:peptidoglycan DD-metalloendopeptidase family protein [Ferrimonas balearica]|uniref:peptidoglycan DD-metalloendopeptidase family protein n=1 Tax=Ferrimonas balearica TaxID=44012 RepID=UPI001C9A25DC|nr:peptidoglycan DD-metalloendopeptidase family protein [Ferrimonas balearica]MBY5991305.1 peptidoglycan DD-metalloendopeptidase family protein [Ferrimonas balearica]
MFRSWGKGSEADSIRRRNRRLQNQLNKRRGMRPVRSQARPLGQPSGVARALSALLPRSRNALLICGGVATVATLALVRPQWPERTQTDAPTRVALDWQGEGTEQKPIETPTPLPRPERPTALVSDAATADEADDEGLELADSDPASESLADTLSDDAFAVTEEAPSELDPLMAEPLHDLELSYLPEVEATEVRPGWLARLFGRDKEATVALSTPDQAPEVIHPPIDPEAEPAEPLGPVVNHYTIESGDTLSGLFSRFGISQAQMYQVLEADYSVLALDTLMPGNDLMLEQDRDDNALNRLEVVFNAAHRVVYERMEDNTFEVQELRIDGDWLASAVETEIQGSFYLSAERAGLTPAEISRITTLFNDKLDFRRQLRAGDSVRVLRESQYVEGESTGQDRLLAVIFAGRNWEQSAYLHDDGNYYDSEGHSLARAFMRVPVQGKYRNSSGFNPRRLHPVTGRIAPHNGTDFAAPTGTPILAAGDGRVTRVENHPIAGKYVVIEHGGQYRTRYLHMSRIDVSRGQTVTRGQRIGAVGATGRVTGAHLHYEFHINGRPVNPMTANIPMATSVDKADRQAFLAKVYQYQAQMAQLAKANGPASERGPAGAAE